MGMLMVEDTDFLNFLEVHIMVLLDSMVNYGQNVFSLPLSKKILFQFTNILLNQGGNCRKNICLS